MYGVIQKLCSSKNSPLPFGGVTFSAPQKGRYSQKHALVQNNTKLQICRRQMMNICHRPLQKTVQKRAWHFTIVVGGKHGGMQVKMMVAKPWTSYCIHI